MPAGGGLSSASQTGAAQLSATGTPADEPTMGVIAILALACALVLVEVAIFFSRLSSLRTLLRLTPPDPSRWPRVSVIVPARNEADTIGPALRSRLLDDYPDLEVIVVDDRSDDGTGTVIDRVTEGDSRVVKMRIESLPEGWLGKTHALELGVRRATGEWLLFSDADVRVTIGALRRAVALAEADGLDLIALVPGYRTGSFAIDAVWAVFMRLLALSVDPRKIRDPMSPVSMGSGAFNLVRRSAFESTPGFEHLRLETGDDAALGVMLKTYGARCEMLDGAGCASVAVYRSVGEFLHGIEKNGSTLVDKPFAVLFAGFVLFVAIELAPFVALFLGPAWLRVLGFVAVVAMTSANAAALWANTRQWLPGLAWPFGDVMMAFGLLRSTWLAAHRGGVFWRGTFYAADELLAQRRFTL